MSGSRIQSFTAKRVKSSVVGDYISIGHKNYSLTTD
jgi:hypothetical protein